MPLVALLSGIWVAFVVFTVVVLADYGLVGFIEAAVANGAVTQVSIDLVLSIVIALSFIRIDASRAGLPYWPYLLATIATGSIGLLAYLIHRTWRGLVTY
jgi:hypothetical protein